MLKIKTDINRTSVAHNNALKKLKDGNGNIIRIAKKNNKRAWS